MNGSNCEAALGEIVSNFLSLALGAREDHRELATFGLQYASDHFDFVEWVGTPYMLLDCVNSFTVTAGLTCTNMCWCSHVATSQVHDLTWHRCREQHCLALGRNSRNDALNVRQETHVEHFVSFVKNECANAAQIKIATVRQVDDATWSSDNNIDAVLESFNLRLVCPTAIDGKHLDATKAASALEVSCNLQAEFTSRANHDGLWLIAITFQVNALKEWNAKAQSFTGSGLGLADDVATFESHR
ncbi:unannotated protein [freshwater metagenome]|uniref:Unannotated protein n=1 Tax=freshwater metagenome TaxID=449393 RepID=A0A6J7H2J6_9ZZZZ